MGNCGVGFAPCRNTDHEVLIQLMEGVEEIPETAMNEGLPWDWESFPEFLDSLDRKPRDIDGFARCRSGSGFVGLNYKIGSATYTCRKNSERVGEDRPISGIMRVRNCRKICPVEERA